MLNVIFHDLYFCNYQLHKFNPETNSCYYCQGCFKTKTSKVSTGLTYKTPLKQMFMFVMLSNFDAQAHNSFPDGDRFNNIIMTSVDSLSLSLCSLRPRLGTNKSIFKSYNVILKCGPLVFDFLAIPVLVDAVGDPVLEDSCVGVDTRVAGVSTPVPPGDDASMVQGSVAITHKGAAGITLHGHSQIV